MSYKADGAGDHTALFEPFQECRACLVKLAGTAAKMAADDPEIRAGAEAAGRAVFDASEKEDISSPELANRMLREIRRVSGAHDPYFEYKKQEMALAGQVFERLKETLRPGLKPALTMAALGNSLDFFRPAREAMPEMEKLLAGSFTFTRDDSDKLEAILDRKPDLVLYLADNSGEAYFDIPLYEHLASRAGRVVLVVKGGPALNDLTLSDLENSDLKPRIREAISTGADGAGLDWENLSPDFLELLQKADLVMAKGMANFETLYPKPLHCPTLFIFKVKCRPMKDFLKAPPESFWALWREAGA